MLFDILNTTLMSLSFCFLLSRNVSINLITKEKLEVWRGCSLECRRKKAVPVDKRFACTCPCCWPSCPPWGQNPRSWSLSGVPHHGKFHPVNQSPGRCLHQGRSCLDAALSSCFSVGVYSSTSPKMTHKTAGPECLAASNFMYIICILLWHHSHHVTLIATW